MAYSFLLDLNDLSARRGGCSRSRPRPTLTGLLREELHNLGLGDELGDVTPRAEHSAGAHGLVTERVTEARDCEPAAREGVLRIRRRGCNEMDVISCIWHW